MDTADSRQPGQDPRQRTLYELAHSDIRWAKEQSVHAVYWSFLLFAALIPLAKLLISFLRPPAIIPVAVLVGVLAVIYLLDLNQFAAGSRRRIEKLQKLANLDSDLIGPQRSDPDHAAYLVAQTIAVVLGLAAVSAALLNMS